MAGAPRTSWRAALFCCCLKQCELAPGGLSQARHRLNKSPPPPIDEYRGRQYSRIPI
ncbi:hypothetical protein L211DRAFT_662200 [Terfezia boudieri ATCC MYA-4762]|uniref:Uncharacterized protein n=1 Tax=Terfezia boudieri ATCC MYA-4762 TaxID=1051890 RepID=A0A3N4LEP1_9PEZI|nr:hypothetical protein L211DRAFT_662200 [Terfezia boudieri ATCC MYA-4762]